LTKVNRARAILVNKFKGSDRLNGNVVGAWATEILR